MTWAWLVLVACAPGEPVRPGPADLLPVDEDGRAWVYEATPACACVEEGLVRVHTLEVGEPSVIHTAMDCGSCGELPVTAWRVSADEAGIEAWGCDLVDGGPVRHDPPVLVVDAAMEVGAVLSTETRHTTWLSELVAWEACPTEVVGGECARVQVQALDADPSFPAGTWWLAEGVGIAAFSEARGADEAEWVLVEPP